MCSQCSLKEMGKEDLVQWMYSRNNSYKRNLGTLWLEVLHIDGAFAAV